MASLERRLRSNSGNYAARTCVILVTMSIDGHIETPIWMLLDWEKWNGYDWPSIRAHWFGRVTRPRIRVCLSAAGVHATHDGRLRSASDLWRWMASEISAETWRKESLASKKDIASRDTRDEFGDSCEFLWMLFDIDIIMITADVDLLLCPRYFILGMPSSRRFWKAITTLKMKWLPSTCAVLILLCQNLIFRLAVQASALPLAAPWKGTRLSIAPLVNLTDLLTRWLVMFSNVRWKDFD